ncbi:inorganic phosphate transporter [uncultured Pseudokineococcus sp.]|uniref:inorganic phosphate transporter n=1 Tax=uncultured Pseudokineococcus sp. TaxID=1642928 RepID=UPI00262F40DD|nr:inorganic phosphate transporter [uncultured Pseudokineococcus sp.]
MGVLLGAVVVLALAFAVTNGLHGAAGAVATSVATRALVPRVAVVMAAGFALLGGLLGSWFVVVGVPDAAVVPLGAPGLRLLVAALLGAITWNLLTWRWGMPTSTTHALFGGLAGAALAAPAASVRWDVLLVGVVVPGLAVVVVAALLSSLGVVALLWLLRGVMPSRANRRLRTAQVVAAAATAVGLGVLDAQRTAAVVVYGLAASGVTLVADAPGGRPAWTVVVVAVALAAGVLTGGWRIVRTVGERLAPLAPSTAFVAQATATLVLHASAVLLRTPVSTSLTVSSAVVGAAAVPSLHRVRWRVVGRVALAWLATVPAAGLLAALAHVLVSLVPVGS